MITFRCISKGRLKGAVMYGAVALTAACSSGHTSPRYIGEMASQSRPEALAPQSGGACANADVITAKLEAAQRRGHVAGFAVGIVSADALDYLNAFGTADRETGVQYTTATIQNVASISKTVLGVALIKAQEEEKLDLDDPVNKYLSFRVTNPSHPTVPITIRQLATHSSTIQDTDVYALQSYVLAYPQTVDPRVGEIFGDSGQFLAQGAEVSLPVFLENSLSADGQWVRADSYSDLIPGTRFHYSNVGAALAAFIIERATGETYSDFTRTRIFEPLAMTDTSWSFNDRNRAAHARLYLGPHVPLPTYTLVTYPDGGLRTNASDLAKFLQELIRGSAGRGKVLSDPSYKELFSPFYPRLPATTDVADPFEERNAGVFIRHTPGGFLGHTGADPGVRSAMFFDAEDQTGWLVLMNTMPLSAEEEATAEEIWHIVTRCARFD